LIYGYKINLPTTLLKEPESSYTYDNYAQELKERLRAANQVAKENLKEEKQKAMQKQSNTLTGKRKKYGLS